VTATATVLGEKLYLRPIAREDIDRGWLQWMSDPAITVNLAGAMPVSRDSLLKYYEDSQPPAAAMFAICRREDDLYIGNIRLSAIDWPNRQATYGWLIGDRAAQGKGHGTEALKLMLRFGFMQLGLNRIYTTIWIDNVASIRANEKAGFRREGVLRESAFKQGRFVDTVMVSMLRREYDELYGAR
jgi:RimJ/RimL family protein N-acetyltransferase